MATNKYSKITKADLKTKKGTAAAAWKEVISTYPKYLNNIANLIEEGETDSDILAESIYNSYSKIELNPYTPLFVDNTNGTIQFVQDMVEGYKGKDEILKAATDMLRLAGEIFKLVKDEDIVFVNIDNIVKNVKKDQIIGNEVMKEFTKACASMKEAAENRLAEEEEDNRVVEDEKTIRYSDVVVPIWLAGMMTKQEYIDRYLTDYKIIYNKADKEEIDALEEEVGQIEKDTINAVHSNSSSGGGSSDWIDTAGSVLGWVAGIAAVAGAGYLMYQGYKSLTEDNDITIISTDPDYDTTQFLM